MGLCKLKMTALCLSLPYELHAHPDHCLPNRPVACLLPRPQRFGPLMSKGGAAISLTYIAADRVIPGG
jgi:hypothetical protein